MSVSIPDDLYDKIVEALPHGEERDALIALTDRPNAEKTIMVAVPERFASHFTSALQLGATTAMMCGAPKVSWGALNAAAKEVEALIPAWAARFLHNSDVEKATDMLIFKNATAKAVSGWSKGEVHITAPGSERVFKPFIKGSLSNEEAEDIANQMNAFAERCRPMDLGDPKKSEDLDMNV